jgi:uncharacterized lipoprotein YehR (DUF1307 family)
MKLKKMILGILALLGAVVLVACGTAKSESADFQLFTPGQSDFRNHIEYQGDKMTLLKTTSTVLYTAFGGNSKEDGEQFLAEQGGDQWDGIKGITHDVEYKEDRLIETTSIDLVEVDFDELGKLMPLQTVNGKKAEYLSYKLTKENFEKLGMKEVKDGKFEDLK